MIKEKRTTAPNGISMLLVLLVAQGATVFGIVKAIGSPPLALAAILCALVVFICWFGLFMVHPNEAKVLQLFGKYVGTVVDPGLRWANPCLLYTSPSPRDA